MNWLGVTDINVAYSYLVSQGIPVRYVKAGGGSFVIAHTWVEAYIRANPGPHRSWIPMDPGFKQYTYQAGSLEARSVPFNREEYLKLPVNRDKTAIEYFKDQVQQYLDTHAPGRNLEDISRTGAIVPTDFTRWHVRLPYRAIVAQEPAALTSSDRYQFTLSTIDYLGTSSTVTVSYPEIYGKRVTLSFIPATTSDEQLIQQYGGYYNVPLFSLKVKPAIKLEGQTIATGSRIVGIGQSHYFEIGIIAPGGALIDTATHAVKAGGYYALGLDTYGDMTNILVDRFEYHKQFIDSDINNQAAVDDNLDGEYLFTSVSHYFNSLEKQVDELASMTHSVATKGVSEALTGYGLSYYYDYTQGVWRFKQTSYFIDAPLVIGGFYSIDGYQQDNITKQRLFGMTGSTLENRVWEEMASEDSISTIKGLQYAYAQGIPVYTITQGNINTLLPTMNVDDGTKFYITQDINQGNIVIAPRDTLHYKLWSGSVWISENPVTLTAGYILYGGIHGGSTTEDKKGENPDCQSMSDRLAQDKYRAVGMKESTWTQFNKKGQPYPSPKGPDFGTMQINQPTWGGKTVPGPTKFGPIDMARVKADWQYNIDAGKAIFDAAYDRAVQFSNAHNLNLSEQRLLTDAYFIYNHGGYVGKDKVHYWDEKGVKEIFSKYSEKQKAGLERAQINAGGYLKIYNDKTWATSKKGCK